MVCERFKPSQFLIRYNNLVGDTIWTRAEEEESAHHHPMLFSQFSSMVDRMVSFPNL